MTKRQIKRMVLCAAACVSSCALRAEIDYGSHVNGDEQRLYVDRYGKGEPIVVSNSYLFVEFDYIPAPYRIQRIGQAVVVNDIIVNCLFRGDPPFGENVRVSGVTGDMLKNGGEAFSGLLADFLRMGEVVFLYKSGYQNRGHEPISEYKMSLHVPIFDKLDAKMFPHLMNDAMTNQPNVYAISAITRRTMRRNLTDDHIQAIIEKAKLNPQLLERIRTETGFALEPTGGE